MVTNSTPELGQHLGGRVQQLGTGPTWCAAALAVPTTILGPPPLAPSSCVAYNDGQPQPRSWSHAVSFLLTLTDTRMNGEQVLDRLLSSTSVRASLVYALIDMVNKTAGRPSQWVRDVGSLPLGTNGSSALALLGDELNHLTDRKSQVVLEVIDRTSCFGKQLTN